MLDIQFIRDNAELVAQKSQQKGYKVDVPKLLEIDQKRRELLAEVEEIRRQRNELSDQTKGQKPSPEQIEKGKTLRQKVGEQEARLEELNANYKDLLEAIPNTIPDDTPEGGEENNQPVKHWGDPKKTSIKDHLAWGEAKGYIDFESGAKVAGAKFYYLKGSLVELELALFQYGMQLAIKQGFTPITVPHLVNTRTMKGTGFMARGDEDQIYKIENEDLNLIATAEIPITGLHADEIVDADKLPLLYAGLSPAYRKEAGAYGKHSRGLYRVHQFNKLELYVFCKPDESEKWHQKLVEIEEELCQSLGIPYQMVRIAAGDLGQSAYKKFDIEYWSPADNSYHELMSCSNVTDYQARRLNIRYKDEQGKTQYLHTLNGTAAAFSRVCIAIIENFQNEDGTVTVPESLKPYLGRDVIE